MKQLEMQYSTMDFIGTLNIPELTEKKVTKNDKGVETTDYGAYVEKRGVTKTGKKYLSTSLRISVVTENGDTEYLDISSYTQEGQTPTAKFRPKGSKDKKDMIDIDIQLADDPKTIEQCMDFLVRHIEIGDLKYDTLSEATLIPFMVAHRNEINGKRVCVKGTVNVSEYEDKAQIKYKVSQIRNVYPNEIDDLKIDLRVVYGKGAIKFVPFEDVAQMDVKKVDVDLMFPVMINSKENLIKLVSGNNISLNLDILDFNNTDNKAIYEQLIQLLNIRQVLNEQNQLVDVPLEDFKYYQARFIGHIKSNKREGELNVEDLTMQEKLYLSIKAKTLDDIKKERGIKKTTNKLITIDAIPYDIEEVEVQEHNITGKAPETVSANEAFSVPNSTPATPTPTPVGGFQMPSFSMGLNK